MKRLFLALPPSPEASQELWEAWEPLRRTSPQIRWLEPDQFHVTLLFIGDAEEQHIEFIADEMDNAARLYGPFILKSRGAGQFPLRGAPRVLIESLEDASGQLSSLQAMLHRNLSTRFDLEKRKYHPHITLARVKNFKGTLPPGAAAAGREIVLNDLVLFESQLRKAGAVYTPLYDVPLGS